MHIKSTPCSEAQSVSCFESSIKIKKVPGVLAVLDRRRKNGARHFPANSGLLSERLSDTRKCLVDSFQINFLVHSILYEAAPVLFPPGLPTLGLSCINAPLQNLPQRIFAQADTEQIAIIKILSGQTAQSADDFAHRPSQIEVLTAVSVVQIMHLHKADQPFVGDDQSVVAAAGK
jgi:hypothetical protein